MSHFDIPFRDKNSERKMLAQRIKRLMDDIKGRIFDDSEDAGDFLFRDGQSTIDKIDEGEWTPFGKNDFWGYREQYCWFKQTVKIPERFKGRKVAYFISPFIHTGWDNRDQQFIIYVNGKMVQGLDVNHAHIFLTDCAEGGEEFDIALSAYCDDWTFSGKVQLCATLKTYDPDVNALYYDIRIPWETAHNYNHDSTYRIDIIKALNEACNMLELSTPDREVFKSSVKDASAYLHETIYGEKSDVLVSAVGHTHIDVAWLWRLRQTRDKAGRSFATVINLMKEFPEYKFMSPQAQLYDYVKQDYPELYEEIKEKIKEGRWEAEGSMWVESDTNVISGESLVRQFLVGKRFFRQEFGVDNKIMWLPDVFGYTAALPQIMKLADIDYFMTTKISWSEYNRFPFDTFLWKGIDGSEILSHFAPSMRDSDEKRFQATYTAMLDPNHIIYGWQRYSNKDLAKTEMCIYGHGDGGGGPTRGNIEGGMRMAEGIPGCPQIKMENSLDFFKRLDSEVRDSKRLPKWRGELYLEYHRGTLTAQARNKKYNRKSELLYHDVETLAATAGKLTGASYPADDILDSWKIILLNQFHDIIPGSSISQVYEDSKEQYEAIGAKGRELTSKAIDSLAANISADKDSLVVFNTLGTERTDVVITDMPEKADFAILDSNGEALTWQKTFDGKLAFLAKNVPSKGYKAFTIADGASADEKSVNASLESVENNYYKLTFNGDMNISSLYHKESGRFVAPEGEVLNNLVAYDDRSHVYEAWDIKCYYDEKFWNIDNVKSRELIESGPVRTVIKVEREFNTSTIAQYFVFYPHTCRIDVNYDIDWKERNIALKAHYPVDVNTTKATYDIQFGNVERTTHNNTTWDYAQFEACGHKWADLSDNSFGLAVLNDCKYGWTIKEGSIKPTLLRSATQPNYNQDRERHEFTYAIYPHSGAVCDTDVVYEGYCLNVPLYCKALAAQGGNLPAEYSLVSCDKSNVIIETVKKAEDSDAIIVRAYETWNRKTPVTFTFGGEIANATECNLLEEKDAPVNFGANTIATEFKPFEIKTFKVILK